MELRTSAAGKEWCRLSVGIGEGDEVTWVSVAVFEEKARVLAGLAKGVEVYVEGRLTMNTWEGKDGKQADRAVRNGVAADAARARSGGGSPRYNHAMPSFRFCQP